MDHKPILWEKDSDQLQTSMRQPKTLPIYSTPQQTTQSNSLELNDLNAALNDSVKQNEETDLEKIVANSKLRAVAPEWFPSQPSVQSVYLNNQVETNRSSSSSRRIQDRLKIRDTDVANNSADNSSGYSSDFNRLNQIIATLTKDPGQFHNLLELFMETLAPYLDDIISLSNVAGIIISQAINHPNFRYTGARLCWYVEQNSPGFRAELHLKCKKHIDENADTKNVLLLIAELFTQLPHLTIYGTLLISALKKLIETGGNDNVKCICQALKLTGYTLDRSNSSDLDKVFNDLKSLRGKVDGSASYLLESVFQLRSSNWGHSAEEAINQEEDDVSFDDMENKVMFDLDGEGLTNEESEFIATHMISNDDFDSEDFDPDELCDPEPEMDEEIQEAFKEFVRLSGKH